MSIQNDNSGVKTFIKINIKNRFLLQGNCAGNNTMTKCIIVRKPNILLV